MEERLDSAFPNIFYDLIVFVSPSVLLITGIVTGLSGWPFVSIDGSKLDLGATDVFVVLLILLFLGYEYGRLAEALSSSIVGKPLKFFGTRKWAFTNCDFNSLLTDEVNNLPLAELTENRRGSKWTIYFFATLVAPHLGRDLLKRYAWEKLSRSSAMTLGMLFLCSVIFLIFRFFGWKHPILGTWGFGSFRYTIASGLLTLATYYEYYQRNCWNNDLLCKTIPVLVYAANRKSGEAA
jgi:hypothetical protein